MMEIAHRHMARAAFRAWPFQWGHDRIMRRLRAPDLPETQRVGRLRRYGVRIRYNPSSYIGKYIYYRGLFEEPILRTIEQELDRDATFIDVGANIGQHTLVASTLAANVVAFEPQATVRQALQENLALS